MGHAGQEFSNGASTGKHDAVDHRSDARVDKDGTYGEVQHQEYDPGAAFVRMSGAQKNNATQEVKPTASKPKEEKPVDVDLGSHLLKDITKESSDIVKDSLKNPLIDKTLYDTDDKPKDKYFTKHNEHNAQI